MQAESLKETAFQFVLISGIGLSIVTIIGLARYDLDNAHRQAWKKIEKMDSKVHKMNVASPKK